MPVVAVSRTDLAKKLAAYLGEDAASFFMEKVSRSNLFAAPVALPRRACDFTPETALMILLQPLPLGAAEGLYSGFSGQLPDSWVDPVEWRLSHV